MKLFEESNIKDLIGKHIIKAEIIKKEELDSYTETDIVVLTHTKGRLYLSWVGDCCTSCYIENITGAEYFKDATITDAYNLEWKDVNRDEDNFDVLESMGTEIITTKGRITIESRASHNGYYGGWINVSNSYPLDQYANKIVEFDEQNLKPLQDI